jgi:hypothetical protein
MEVIGFDEKALSRWPTLSTLEEKEKKKRQKERERDVGGEEGGGREMD